MTATSILRIHRGQALRYINNILRVQSVLYGDKSKPETERTLELVEKLMIETDGRLEEVNNDQILNHIGDMIQKKSFDQCPKCLRSGK